MERSRKGQISQKTIYKTPTINYNNPSYTKCPLSSWRQTIYQLKK